MMNLDVGLILDPFCSPKEWKSCDRKCYVRRSKPYIMGASSVALQLADDDPWVETFDEELSSTERIVPSSFGVGTVQNPYLTQSS